MGAVFGIRAHSAEEVEHELVEKHGKLEIRQYHERWIVETLISRPIDKAQGEGFMKLFHYISGANDTKTNFPMTIPVELRPNDRCRADPEASLRGSAGEPLLKNGSTFFMRFFLPHDVVDSKVPNPKDPEVRVNKLEPELYATYQFSGSWSEDAFEDHGKALLHNLKRLGYRAISELIYLTYDPPFTIPCFRRNEVAVIVEQI